MLGKEAGKEQGSERGRIGRNRGKEARKKIQVENQGRRRYEVVAEKVKYETKKMRREK